MAAEKDQNVFALPWNDSDMVLVVEDQELHVHKWILKSQSPVFKAMFDGHFQEASQDKITLKEKEYKSMIKFLKALYPSSMFETAETPLDDESRLSIIALADEYQCVNLIKKCINEVKMTPENVLQILPYAVKHDQTSLVKMYDVIKWGVPTAKLEKLLPEIESKETSNTMLLTKCRFLESSVVRLRYAILPLIGDFLDERKYAVDAKEFLDHVGKLEAFRESRIVPIIDSSYSRGSFRKGRKDRDFPRPSTPSEISKEDSRCSHSVNVFGINRTKSCLNCQEQYKEKFLNPIPSYTKIRDYFDMLQTAADVAMLSND